MYKTVLKEMFIVPSLVDHSEVLVFFCQEPSSNTLEAITQLAGLQSMAGSFGNAGINNGATTTISAR